MDASRIVIDSQEQKKGVDAGLNDFASKKLKSEVHSVLGNIFEVFGAACNVKNIIDPNKIYVAKFPPELLKKMQTNDIQFLRDKMTDEILPTLYDYTEKGIGGQVRLEVKGEVSKQDFSNLLCSFSNLIEQKRYDDINEQLQIIYLTVKTIERGQQNDRIAKVLSGKNMLLNALAIEDNDELKSKLICEAIAQLSEGKEMIERSLIDSLNNLTTVPKSKFLLHLIVFINGNYDKKKIAQYEAIQELFKYYCISLSSLSYAYTYLGQNQMTERIIKSCSAIFEHNKLMCLTSIEPLLSLSHYYDSTSFERSWYNQPQYYENQLLQTVVLPDTEKEICIKLNGNELLEVLYND